MEPFQTKPVEEEGESPQGLSLHDPHDLAVSRFICGCVEIILSMELPSHENHV